MVILIIFPALYVLEKTSKSLRGEVKMLGVSDHYVMYRYRAQSVL